jgi:uncharacterized protein (DUF952 family)
VQLVLGAGSENQRAAGSMSGLRSGGASLDGLGDGIDRLRLWIEVLDGDARRSGLADERDRLGHPVGGRRETPLGIDVDGYVDGRSDRRHVVQQLGPGDVLIGFAERGGVTGAGRGESHEAERLEQSGRTDIPRIREHKQVVGRMQGSKALIGRDHDRDGRTPQWRRRQEMEPPAGARRTARCRRETLQGMNLLFHILDQPRWDEARALGVYEPESLTAEGFIHLSTADQVLGTANRLYAGRTDLVVLAIDADAVTPEIRFEDLYDHGAEFPHLYGPLATSAVHHVVPLEAGQEATFTFAFPHEGGDVEALGADYPSARRRFLDAAVGVGATIESFAHPRLGLNDEELFVDVARLGPDEAEACVLVVSATHGVEGLAGSALQTHWLSEHAHQRPDGVAVLLVHALNPFGFSWVRRANEDNVDLNRNFIDWNDTIPANAGYAQIASALVPVDWSIETQRRSLADLLTVAGDWGFERMQTVVSSGQYAHPTGVFYGGDGPVWSHRWLRSWASDHLAGARDLAVLDLHTGLGAWGACQLIGHDGAGTAGHARAGDWWGPVVTMGDENSVSAALTGDWLGVMQELAPSARTTRVALEFGTVDAITVLQSLRADAWLHAHGDPRGDEAAAIRAQVRAAFADDDPRWIRSCWPHFARAMTATFANIGR